MNTLDSLNHFGERSYHRTGGNESSIRGTEISNVSAKLQSSVETSILSSGIDGGRQVFSKSIEASFSLSVSFERPEFEFKVPSPSDVAQTVLGFVERRISNEVEAGADDSRVSDLLSQARKGVEAGFASAKEDIESLGLMSDTLEEEIDESRSIIDKGIDNIEQDHFQNGSGDQSVDTKDDSSTEQADRSATDVKNASDGNRTQSTELNVYDFFSQSHDNDASVSSAPIDSVSNYKFASHESSEFSLKTRDGDTVSIRFSDSFASVYQASNNSQGFASASNQAFEFSVEGELDEEEIAAINELLAQVGEVADLFFENRFQDAFASALNIGFDSSEIAAFSLDLSKAVVEEVRSYGGTDSSTQGTDLAAVQRYQPVVDMVNHFSQIREVLDVFESPRENVASLISETLERVRELANLVQEQSKAEERADSFLAQETKVSISQFMEFSEYVLLS